VIKSTKTLINRKITHKGIINQNKVPYNEEQAVLYRHDISWTVILADVEA